MKADAVQELLKIVGEVTQADPAALSRADLEIRREFGCTAVRILPRAPVTLDQIDAGLRQRKPVALIATEVGLSRATVYRMLGRNRIKNRNRSGAETPGKAK